MSTTEHGPLTFGVSLPFFDHQLDYPFVLEFATTAQELGFDGLWASDHIVTGPFETRTWYDVTTLLAGLAPVVPRMTLGTDVVIVPFRHPLGTAKSLVTLDVASGGRLIIGVGVGNKIGRAHV